ncbi:MAG: multicopper oxidase domain-containing protein, partial [Ktedonobacteraceae bacterium]|nr:multicopper oxidase domain-containing protein [Ktedonobacteraceae bacterium]
MAMKEPNALASQEKTSEETTCSPASPPERAVPRRPPHRHEEPSSRGFFAAFGLMIFFGVLMFSLLSFGIGASVVHHGSDLTTSTSQTSMSGMSNTSNTTASANVPNATQQYGNQLATYTLDPDGAKHFTFTAEQVMWEVVKGHRELAWTINGTVPGPMLRVTAGDHIRITFTNHFPTATAVHWHGLEVPTSADGVPGLGQ